MFKKKNFEKTRKIWSRKTVFKKPEKHKRVFRAGGINGLTNPEETILDW